MKQLSSGYCKVSKIIFNLHCAWLKCIFALSIIAAGMLPRCHSAQYTFEYFAPFPGDDYIYDDIYPVAINDHGLMVGLNVSFRGVSNFVGSIKAGFTPLQLPGVSNISPFDVNNAGDIVGMTRVFPESFVSYADGTVEKLGDLHAVVVNNLGQIVVADISHTDLRNLHIREPNGEIRPIVYPAGFDGYLGVKGLNDLGQMSGEVIDAGGSTIGRGFILDTVDGSFETFAYPGEQYTITSKINNAGMVVGRAFTDPANQIGFVRMPSGEFIEIEAPGGDVEDVLAINNRGQIAGSVRLDGTERLVGFVATPVPEPATIGMVLIAFGACFNRRRRVGE